MTKDIFKSPAKLISLTLLFPTAVQNQLAAKEFVFQNPL